MITNPQASTLVRFFVRLEQQIERAAHEQRKDEMRSLLRLYGALHYRVFGLTALNDSFGEGL